MQNKRYHFGVTNYYLSFQEDKIIYRAVDKSLTLHSVINTPPLVVQARYDYPQDNDSFFTQENQYSK